MGHEQEQYEAGASNVFCDMEWAQREQLYKLMNSATYSTGQIFYSPDEPGEQLFVLQSGRVRIYKLSPEGRALTLTILEPVTVFGEMSLVGHRLHDSFAEAMTDCVIGVIKRDTLRQMIENSPVLARCFMELIGQRLREIESKLADVAFKSVSERLATVLLNMASMAETQLDTMIPEVVRYTHQQLAELIGSYRETVTKAIGEFRETGLIRIEEDTIYLTDVKRLQQLANKSALV